MAVVTMKLTTLPLLLFICPSFHTTADINTAIWTQSCNSTIPLCLEGSESSNSSGNVYVAGKPICDDHWSITDADIVCRQLGFSRAKAATWSSKFGNAIGNFSMDDVKCSGSETNITDCKFSLNANCDKQEAAGVVCDTRSEEEINNIIRNCFAQNVSYVEETKDKYEITSDSFHCKELCEERTGCHRFTFLAKKGKCFTTTGSKKSIVEGAISGPQKCKLATEVSEKEGNCKRPNTICLEGGRNTYEGNVFIGGKPVCDDGWNMLAANTVCKDISGKDWLRAKRIYTNSHYGQVSGNFSMSQVVCSGIDDKISDCQYQTTDNCDGLEAAGVVCDIRTKGEIAQEEKKIVKDCFIEDFSYAYFDDAAPQNDDESKRVHLVGGKTPYEGNVFIGSKPICDDMWDLNDATVVCRQLGHGVVNKTWNSHFGTVPDVHAMDQVACNGTERSILECQHSSEDDCGESEGAGVVCEHYVKMNSVLDCQTYCSDHDTCSHFTYDKISKKCSIGNAALKMRKSGTISGPKNCTIPSSLKPLPNDKCTGKVCLKGGRNESEGNVFVNGKPVCVCLKGGRNESEGNVFVNGKPVCDDFWNLTSANVVCQQLGHFRALNATTDSYFGNVQKNYGMDDVNCTGKEDSINQCMFNIVHNCDVGEAAGVICDTGNYTLNLRGGDRSYEGTVFLGNKPICDDFWDNNDTAVVCRQLGFEGYVKNTKGNNVGTSDFAMDDVKCVGNETSLNKCIHKAKDDCGNTEGAGVVCDIRSKRDIDAEKRKIKDCFLKGSAFDSSLKIDNKTVTSVTECQKHCQKHVKCTHFSYLEGECTRSSGNDKTDANPITISGPKHCDTISNTPDASSCPICLNGKSASEGNVFVNGKPVCDDGWNIVNGHVVCKQLGYSRALSTSSASKYGKVTADYSMDDVFCFGNESKLEECIKSDLPDNCDGTEAAGVVCDTRTAAQIKAEEEKLTKECYIKNTTYDSEEMFIEEAKSAIDCQDHCQARLGCSHFTFLKKSSECRLLTATRFCRQGHTSKNITLEGMTVEVPCVDSDDEKGPWIVMQRRGQFGNDKRYFSDMLWADYVKGFGSVHGEFWLGLDNLVKLTNFGTWEMRVDLTDWDGAQYFALYDYFSVGPGPKYKLSLYGYNLVSTLGDSLTGTESGNGQGFSTSDYDNDNWSGNCALKYKGAWWYESCQKANLNSINYRQQETNSDAQGIYWKFGGARGYGWVTWRGVQIKIRRKDIPGNRNLKIKKEGAVTGPRDCSDANVSINDNPLCKVHQSVCLVGGIKNQVEQVYKGNVMVAGKPVCDDYWSKTQADIVCKQLGFFRAKKATFDSEFGNVLAEFAMDDVNCTGTERSIKECKHSAVDNCDGGEAAGVVCDSRIKEAIVEEDNLIKTCFIENVAYLGGFKQVINTTTVTQCQMKCQQSRNCTQFSYNGNATMSCILHSAVDDFKSKSLGTISGPRFCPIASSLVNVDSQGNCSTENVFCLAGGNGNHEGNVFIGGTPVCDDSWSLMSANFVCKKIGLFRARNVTTNSTFGNVSASSFMNVTCDSSESCSFDQANNCDGYEAAGVVCDTRDQVLRDQKEEKLKKDCYMQNSTYVYIKSDEEKNETVTLRGGKFPYEGNVFIGEVPVCHQEWNALSAAIVCKQLGYELDKLTTSSNFGHIPSETTHIKAVNRFNCSGDEYKLSQCPHKHTESCLEAEAAGVVCKATPFSVSMAASSALDCQETCQAKDSCNYFAFAEDTHQCHISSHFYNSSRSSTISGPKNCPKRLLPTESATDVSPTIPVTSYMANDSQTASTLVSAASSTSSAAAPAAITSVVILLLLAAGAAYWWTTRRKALKEAGSLISNQVRYMNNESDQDGTDDNTVIVENGVEREVSSGANGREFTNHLYTDSVSV